MQRLLEVYDEVNSSSDVTCRHQLHGKVHKIFSIGFQQRFTAHPNSLRSLTNKLKL